MYGTLAQGKLIFGKDNPMAYKRTKEELEKAAKQSSSIAEMCRTLGLRPCGGNYRQMHNTIEKFALDTSHFTGQGWNVGLKFKPFEKSL